MKKNYTILMLMAGTIGSLAFMSTKGTAIEKVTASHLYASGGEAGRTGAPGESSCMQCHTGTTQTGSNSLVVMQGTTPVTSYVPGTTYNVGITFTNAGIKNGFEVVALTSSNAQAGSVTAGPGTQVVTGSAGKKYVTHTSTGNTQTAWAFQWTAPSTNVGTVKFYLATNQTNNNGGSDAGDIIRLSNHTIGVAGAGITENTSSVNMKVGFASSTDQLVIDMSTLTAGNAYINLVDLSGKSVFHEDLGAVSLGENQLKVRLPETVTSGIYIAHVGVNNNLVSQKVAIQK